MAYVLSSSLPQRRRFSLLARLLNLDTAYRQRAQVERLDEHLLQDMGLTRADLRAAVESGAWDAPESWRQ
ncbi:MAG: DUF1127 domain-containing protein [Roseivivax sp.]|nr:DUF1127 domain-containing protein [Roseivivax sp.]